MNNKINENYNPVPLMIVKMEIVGIVLFVVGMIMRFAHVPFYGPITVIALGSLAMSYAIGAFAIISMEEDEKPYTLLNIASGILLAITCIGILFRLMYWPFSQIHLTTACIGLPIAFIGLFVAKSNVKYQETAKIYLLKLIRVTVFFALAATLYSISLKTQIEVEHWDDAEMARLKYKHISNPKNEAFKKEYFDYRNNKLNQ